MRHCCSVVGIAFRDVDLIAIAHLVINQGARLVGHRRGNHPVQKRLNRIRLTGINRHGDVPMHVIRTLALRYGRPGGKNGGSDKWN